MHKFIRQLTTLLLTTALCLSFNSLELHASNPEIQLEKTDYQPLDMVTLTFEDSGDEATMWIGLLPAEIEDQYDLYHIHYQWTANLPDGTWSFQLPRDQGDYKVGIFVMNDGNRIIAMSDVIESYHETITVTTDDHLYVPNQKVTVKLSDAPNPGHAAWVGLIPGDLEGNFGTSFLVYQWVSNLTDLTWTFNTPTVAGDYKVCVCLENSNDFVVGLSEPFAVKRVPVAIDLSTNICQPGDSVYAELDHIPLEKGGWIGLFSEEVHDNYGTSYIKYQWLDNLENQVWKLEMPWVEGSYKLGVFLEYQNDLTLGMSDIILSSYDAINVTCDQQFYDFGEKAHITINERPTNTSAYLGLVPADTTTTYASHIYQSVWVRDLKGLEWEIQPPQSEGWYKVGVFLSNDANKLIGISDRFFVGDESTAIIEEIMPIPEVLIPEANLLPTIEFTDLDQEHWSYEYVQHLVHMGIINGYCDHTFKPNAMLKRSEFAKLLATTFELPTVTEEKQFFSDMPLSHWANPYVQSCLDYLTYYKRSDDYYYLPDTPALREDVAVSMVKAMGLDEASADDDQLSAYKDVNDISEDLKPYIALAIEHGVMVGNDGYFYPSKKLTRAEASTLFARYLLEIKEKNNEDYTKTTQ